MSNLMQASEAIYKFATPPFLRDVTDLFLKERSRSSVLKTWFYMNECVFVSVYYRYIRHFVKYGL